VFLKDFLFLMKKKMFLKAHFIITKWYAQMISFNLNLFSIPRFSFVINTIIQHARFFFITLNWYFLFYVLYKKIILSSKYYVLHSCCIYILKMFLILKTLRSWIFSYMLILLYVYDSRYSIQDTLRKRNRRFIDFFWSSFYLLLTLYFINSKSAIYW